MRYDSPTFTIEIGLAAGFDTSNLSKKEIEHLNAFLAELLRELVEQAEPEDKE